MDSQMIGNNHADRLAAARRKPGTREENEHYYKAIFENEPACVKLLTNDGILLKMNPAGLRMLGAKNAEQVCGRCVYPFVVPEHRDAFRNLNERAAAGSAGTIEFQMIGLTGKRLWLETYAVPHRLGNRTVVLAITQDVTARKGAEETIYHHAYYDALTELPNRLLFQDRSAQALARATRNKELLAMLFLDLDRFKNINDTLGHPAGDELLRLVAQRLEQNHRKGDTVARLGSDHFMILATGISSKEDAARIARNILQLFKTPFPINGSGQSLHITSSIGVSLYPYDGEDVDTLQRNADTALHQARARGGNCYQLYTPAMNAKAMEQLNLEHNLRGALERNEFLLHFQPQIELDSSRAIGVEALLRWQQNPGALTPPCDFIPLAEETGMIVPIGEWALRDACLQSRKWRNNGSPDLTVAVNISARQLQQPDFIDTITRVIKETEMDPGLLELEITESTLMKNPEEAVPICRTMRNMGIQLAIDDFGTGYSSLSYLRKLPLSSLKIDSGFVRDLTTDPDDAAITASIISMAHTLSLTVVAEGVETEEQLAFLREHRCDRIQGFLISHPIPADGLPHFFHCNPNAV